MTSTIARLGVDITANDKTAPGVRSAEKRTSGVVKNAGREASAAQGQIDRVAQRTRVNLGRTFSSFEDAAKRAFGPGGGGIISRMGAVSQASSALGTGLGEASASGGILSQTMGTLGVVAAGTAGIIAGVAFATDKLVGSWAKGVAGAGQLARTIGISTQALQEFQGAAERMGVDKATSGGGLANLATTLNDAQNARNPQARVLLRKLGVDFKTKADGSVDAMAMLPAIARGLQAQNAQGRVLVANQLGLGSALVPVLAQGPQALTAEMTDVGKNGNVVTDAQVDKATNWRRKRVMVGQMAERGMTQAGEVGADASSGALDAMLAGGHGIIDGSIGKTIVAALPPAAHAIERGAERFAGAVSQFVSGVLRPGQSHVNSFFGARRRPRLPGGGYGSAMHQGVDFRAAEGTPIGVVAAGVVKEVRKRSGYGQTVMVDHGGGHTSFYAHLSRALVKVGDKVATGQKIALSGSDGGDHKVAPHLHYGEQMSGRWIDPYGKGGILASQPQLASYLNNAGGLMGRDGRFKRFAAATDSIKEMASTLSAYQDKHGIDTIDGIANRWAPKGHGKNDPELYARDLSQWTGRGRGDHLDLHEPRMLAQLVAALMRQESGARADPAELERSIMEIRFVNAPAGTTATHRTARGRISHAQAGHG